MTAPADNVTVKQQAQNLADGLGISVFITKDGRIVQHDEGGGTEVLPGARAKPTPHGAPAEIKPAEETS